MALAVVSYPKLSAKDFDWIQALRKSHDKLYLEVIEPHFTIVFPEASIDQAEFINHLKQKSIGVRSFSAIMRCSVLVKDEFSEYTHVFLVPDEGYSNIVKLHDHLYTGPLTESLRLDIPYIPHLGIANSLDSNICKALVDHLNAENFEIKGIIESMDVIWYENNQVKNLEQIQLQ